MRRMLFVLLMINVSCSIKEMGIAGTSVKDGVWVSTEISSGIVGEMSCVVTAFSYPESFDWYNGDVTKVKSSLIAFKDGTPIVRLSVGEGYNVSHEPDRHRFIEGHLYTDCPVNGEMVLSVDGKQIVRYEGEERIVGMVIENGHVYTLGVPADGEGFVYRRDGEALISKHSGTVFKRLEKDDDKICFAYGSRFITGDGEQIRYYMVRDGVEKRIELPTGVDIVMDVISHKGETCCVAFSSYSKDAYYYREGFLRVLDLPRSAVLTYASFINGNNEAPCLEGVYESVDGTQTCAIWIEADEYLYIDNKLSVSYACTSSDWIGFVMNPLSSDSNGLIMAGSEVSTMPEGYRCIGRCPVAMDEQEMFVGLSSTKKGRPLLWRGGIVDTLDINGYISTVNLSGH